MSSSDVKLVLNINTPNYFETGFQRTEHHASKRPFESSVGFVSTKKPKLSRPIGKSFRSSSQLSKLKIVSSLSKLNKYSSSNELDLNSESVGSRNLPPDGPVIKTTQKQKKDQPKVSFNSNVEVFPISKDSVANTPKLLQPDYLTNKSSNVLKPITKKTSNKAVISSLFNKNPDLPVLPISDVKQSNQEVFSSLTFNDLDIDAKLISTVEKFGYTNMTLVQQLGIPSILQGNDALIKSQTGSGKTLTYVLPIVHNLMSRQPKIERQQGLYALIAVPTRELAIQTYQLVEKLCKCCISLVPGYLMGGEKKKAEKARLRRGINILVATPGRLMDHIDNTNSLSLAKVEYLVLDEADRMLDMGYEKNIMSIVRSWKKEREEGQKQQTILLSATLTSAVEKLADMSLSNPKVVDVTTDTRDILADGGLVTPKNLSHYFMMVPQKLRMVSLAAFILHKCRFTEERKMLVFMTTQDMVDYHTGLFSHVLSRLGKKRSVSSLEQRATKVLSGGVDDEEEDDDDEALEEDLETTHPDEICFMKLHGNMSQPERTAVFKSFHKATSGVLLCTDVASRGLDLPRVHWIVQFNPACQAIDYVHRVGRTARANNAGSAVVFVTPAESTYVKMLEDEGIRFVELKAQQILKGLMHPSLFDRDVEKVPTSMEFAATRLQDKFENAVESNKDMYNMAVQGYASFVRSYAAIPKVAREFFSFKLLHLGHCAKSFALRDPPAVLGGRGASALRQKNVRSRKRFERTTAKEPLFRTSKVISEFDSGFEECEEGETKGRMLKKRKPEARSKKRNRRK